MFERFTERARQVVVLAQEEARSLRHNHIGTAHILLGLLREEDGLGAQVLNSLGLSLERVRAEIVRRAGDTGDEVTSGQIPFTPRAKKVLELSLREALSLSHDYIATEHILLGLVREAEGTAVQILIDFGADPETVRNEVIRLLPESKEHLQTRATATVRPGELRFTVSPDREMQRLLMAAAGRALIDGRREFGLADLLAAVEEQPE